MIKGIKICGVSDLETLKFIINHPNPPAFIGFVSNYKKSRRYVDYETLKILSSYKHNSINFVSVLVNPGNEFLEKIKDLRFDYYQLYDVDPERTKLIKKKYNKRIISSLMIQDEKDILEYKKYENISEIILFDGKGYEKSISFDHKLLNIVPNHITKMIAGDIKVDNIPLIENFDYYIDLSGSLENKYGKKDLQKINKFLNTIKEYET